MRTLRRITCGLDGDDELEVAQRLLGALHHRDRVQQIDAVEDETLDRVGVAGDHRWDQLLHRRRTPQERGSAPVGPCLSGWSKGKLVALLSGFGGTTPRATGHGEGWVWIGLEVRRLVEVHTTLTPVGPEQGVDDVHRPHSLGVVAVPGDVAAGMDERGRTVACHLPCGLPDHVGGEAGRDGDPQREVLAESVVAAHIGGFHLACDARDNAAVHRLRASKRRDGKPFAVMVLNTACAARYIRCDRAVKVSLQSGERPVVIADSADGIGQLSPDLSPGLGTLGVMLPYTAVHYLLFHALLGQPPGRDWLESENDLALVMTSANISGDPLITRRRAAAQQLAGLADRFLHHDRHIAARADDSVVRYAAGHPCIVRRARGFTPHAIKLASDGPRVLALGPRLKSTVTMTRGNRAYVSPHVGDLDTPAAVSFHSETAQAMQDMLQATPELLACDLSADFASTRLAERLSESLGRPLVRVPFPVSRP